MKKILLTSNHPAPYIDLWVNELNKEYLTDTLYVQKHSIEKNWKNFSIKNLRLYSDYTLYQKFLMFKKYDLVILCGWGIFENVILSLLLFPNKTKVAFFLDHPIIGKTKVDSFSKLIKKIIIKSANYILPASKSCLEYLKEHYNVNEEKLLLFPYAHTIPNLSDCEKINILRNKELLNHKKIRLFVANRFEERKGYNILYKAFEILKSKNVLDNFEVVIAGNGKQFDFYKNKFDLLNSNIELVGWIENEEYEFFLNNCDVYVHASLFEPFGIPPIDAMQRGKNVVLSCGVKSCDLLNIKDINGVKIYDSNNYNELASILYLLSINKHKIYNSKNEIIKLAEENYSINVNLKSIRKILNK